MHSPRAAFSLLLALGLAITLGLKAQTLELATAPDLARFNAELASMLTAQGFAVSIEDRQLDMDLVVARRGTCALKARAEETADRLLALKEFAGDLPVVRFRYRSTLRKNFPRGEFDLRNLAGRIGLRLGLTETSEWPLAIAASPVCPLDRIDFGPQQIYRRVSD